ncbi:MAG TPA: ATP-binding protein [Candidatus Pacearchaeota archaeon]|nr:ATP-binding protein [Candidatus Pacearchaeota archaeon]HPR79799.1 ATP-binding protein [Candidatus Pacearchaeota archaeon]
MSEKILNFTETKEDELRRVRAALLNILEDTEEARREAVREKNKTMAIIENLTDGIFLLNNKNEVEIISPLVVDFFKKNKEEIIGKNIVDLFDSEELKEFKELLIDSKKGKINKVTKKEISIGQRMNIEVYTIFLEEKQEEGGILIILHDVTRDKLIEKMKTEFVSIAAHQLRTPLSAIKWTLRMVLDGETGDITQEQKDLLEKTYVSNERMISLINDLLNVSRIEEGRFLYKQEMASLEEIISTVIDSSQELLKMKKMKIIFDRPKEILPQVYVDREKMELVVQNLLENAVKYTPEGGEINISLEKKNDEVIFKIKDTGVGIPEAQKERIFTKFFRGDNVIRMETEGSGLGLYTTKNIIDAHKGKIWFDSKEGEGTTFTFTIPVITKS